MCWRPMFFKVRSDGRRMYEKHSEGITGGFTLLEVLVSTAILVVVIAAVYEAFISNVSSVRAARQGEEVNQTGRIILERISEDLVSAVGGSPQKPDKVKLGMISEDREEEGHSADRISFTSFSHVIGPGGGPATDLCEIEYSLEKDPDGAGFILYRRDTAPPDEDFSSGGRGFQLAKHVGSLNFRFSDSDDREFDSWDTLTGESQGVLPSLVTIELNVIDDGGKEHLFATSVHPALSPVRRGK
jgi:prepilin-type N-terminal cleavage/methylation domain-containing protein